MASIWSGDRQPRVRQRLNYTGNREYVQCPESQVAPVTAITLISKVDHLTSCGRTIIFEG